MVYTKIMIDTTVEAVDMVSYTLGELGVEGVQVEDKLPLTEEEKRAMYIDILPEQEKAYDGYARLTCYIPMGQEAEGVRNSGTALEKTAVMNIPELLISIRAELDRLSEFMDVGPKTVTVEDTEDTEWLYNWKTYFKPFRLEENIIIKPTWEKLEDKKPEDIVIELDPGIAFGTGSHDTTKLCVRQLKKYMKAGFEVLDVGCGTGILGMIALRLAAGAVLGLDIDPLAVRVSRENRAQNKISEAAFVIRQGNLLEDAKLAASLHGQFDIVTANILAEVIVPLCGVASPMLRENGIFITSGIIRAKEDEVRQALIKNNFKIVSTDYMGDWVSFAAEKF